MEDSPDRSWWQKLATGPSVVLVAGSAWAGVGVVARDLHIAVENRRAQSAHFQEMLPRSVALDVGAYGAGTASRVTAVVVGDFAAPVMGTLLAQ